ncbi:SigE family RNA polymerase sigma factor [Promicromonospora sp. NPDC023805]|uniref:RNA polymerase sigma factor n=1 Tax=Promicromonospora sp. NPDC023805 TaxID=3154696 RepID=UPI0033F6DFA3
MAQWEAELTELVMRRSGALVGYAYSLTRDKAQAEDLVQDALVKVYSRLRRPSSGGATRLDLDRPETSNPEGYVRRAILTIYLDGYRRRSAWSGFKHLLADDTDAPGADRVATARVDVGVALKRLSPRQRETVVMRFFDDLTVPQIAAALGTTQGTVKRHLFDATAVLREALAEVSVPAMDTDLDERVGTVAGAVRRRRTVKVGALAGATMVLAVALAWSAYAIKPFIRSEPLPADDQVEYTQGHMPGNWPREAGVYCGMPVEEFDALDAGTFDVEITGDLTTEARGETSSWALPVTVEGAVPEGVADRSYFITTPVIVWAHDGRIVDLTTAWAESDADVSRALSETGSWSGSALAGSSSACRADTLQDGSFPEQYDNVRPGAHYELRVVLDGVSGSGASSEVALHISAPITVDLESGAPPAPTFAAPSGDCSGAASAGQDMQAPNLEEPVRAVANQLLEAATTCNEGRIAELGGGASMVPFTEPGSPTANDVFALPEADGRTPYGTVARLLTETRPVRIDSKEWTWPRVAQIRRWGDDDAAWQEAIDAGAITPEQAAEDRAAGRYTGWRLHISAMYSPRWESFYKGDDDYCLRPDAVGCD